MDWGRLESAVAARLDSILERGRNPVIPVLPALRDLEERYTADLRRMVTPAELESMPIDLRWLMSWDIGIAQRVAID